MITMRILVLIAFIFLSGCIGLTHSSHICSYNIEGKYYRATRMDFDFMVKKPIGIPLVLCLDLPFALIIETIEAPFIAFGYHDPRPPEIFLEQIDSNTPLEEEPSSDIEDH
ncbi:MAG: hypothetical protein NE327_15080 [Lentisphaeraceae bacterium]|nr:hypothetical protein [Lentisphaeraceae bacterium]